MERTSLAACILGIALISTVQAQSKVDFDKHIKPIFKKHCYECHSSEEDDGDLRLDHRAGAMQREDADPVVVPGKPNASLLFERITLPADDDDIMPAEGDPLSKAQIALIEKWIKQGAVWPDRPKPAHEDKPKAATISVPEIDAARKAAVTKAMKVITDRGALASRIAQDTAAVDVNFSLLGKDVEDQDVGLLKGLESRLVWLNLSRTKVTDRAVAQLANMKQLRRLNLAGTAMTDASVKYLAGLRELEYLNLYGTAVSDSGLRQLSKLTKLRKLYLWQTKATKAGVARLCRALPDLEADLGEYVALAPPPKASAAVALNAECPVSGKPVVAKHVSTFEGRQVAFCCEKCKAKFDKNPKAIAAKVRKVWKAADAVAAKKAAPKKKVNAAAKPVKSASTAALNAKCPVRANKAAKAEYVSTFEGRQVAFCCGKCKARFDKNPKALAAKVRRVWAIADKAGKKK